MEVGQPVCKVGSDWAGGVLASGFSVVCGGRGTAGAAEEADRMEVRLVGPSPRQAAKGRISVQQENKYKE